MQGIIIFQKKHNNNHYIEIATKTGKITGFTQSKGNIGGIIEVNKNSYLSTNKLDILNEITAHLNFVHSNKLLTDITLYAFYLYSKISMLNNEILYYAMLNLLLNKNTNIVDDESTINALYEVNHSIKIFDDIYKLKNTHITNYLIFEMIILRDLYDEKDPCCKNIKEQIIYNNKILKEHFLQINDFRENLISML